MPTKEAKDAHSLSSLSPQKRPKKPTLSSLSPQKRPKIAYKKKKKKKGPKMPLLLSL
jgi:hypothetical protein